MKSDRATVVAAATHLPPNIRLVFLHGPDIPASTEFANRFARQFADPANPLAVETIAAADLDDDPARLAAAAASVSMFGDRTLIRVEGAGEDVLAAVDLLLAAQDGGNPVVMVAGALKKGSKLMARIESAAGVLSLVSYVPDARGAAAAVEEVAAEFGLSAGRGAARALFEACGGDRMLLRRELEKLALYLDATLTAPLHFERADLDAISADLGEAEISGLVKSIAGGDAAGADAQLARLSALGIPAITLIRSVARRFWQLLDLRQAVDGGASPRSAVEGARPPVFWKERDALTAELGLWRTAMVRGVLARLLAAERGIKRSGTAGEVLASQAFLGIATQVAGRR